MASVFFITHPDVAIDPAIPVPDWCLNPTGIARMRAMLTQPWVANLTQIASSTERKARDGADILASHLGLVPSAHADLGENDRSATGYLPKPAFEAQANAFFANPTESMQGWERAIDAQTRIVGAMRAVLASAPPGDIAVVSHGGVGALLLCYLRQAPISRAADQPVGNGGHFFVFDRESWALPTAWQRIDIRPAVVADLPQFLALLRHLQPRDPPPDPAKARATFVRMLDGGQTIVFLAMSGDALAASCTLTIIPNLTRNARPYAVIENVVTDPAFRRQGLGHAVLRAAQQAAWDADCYKIMLATGRPELVPFYQAAGFALGGKSFFEMRRI